MINTYEAYKKLRLLEEFINSKTESTVWSNLEVLNNLSEDGFNKAALIIDEQYELYSKLSGFDKASKKIDGMKDNLIKVFPPFKA